MKKFLPYFKLLLPVKWRFAIAIIAGIFYGVASGFGLPFMTAKVFPLVFSSEQQGLTLYLKSAEKGEEPSAFSELLSFSTNKKDDSYKEFSDLKQLTITSPLYYTVADATTPIPIPAGAKLSTDGEVTVAGSSLTFQNLLVLNDDGTYTAVEPALYLSKGPGKFQKVDNNSSDQNRLNILIAVLMLPAVFLIRGVAGFINTYYIAYCGQFVLERIRSMVFEKLQRLDLAYFQQMGTGDLMTRFLVQTTRLQAVITGASNTLIKEPVALLSAIAALIYLSITHNALSFILISVGIIPVIILPVRKFSSIMLKKLRQEAKGEIQIGSQLQENIAGARDIRSFNLEEKETTNFHGLLAGYFKQRMKMTKYKGFVMPTVEIITATGVSVAMFYSSRNGMKLETVLPLIVALYMTYEPIKKIAALQTQLVFGQLAIEMMDKILKREEKVKDPENPKPLPPLKGGITYEKVFFKYDKGKPALRQINTTINPGEVVALVGPSGAGKSTFTHLISRTYEITKGKIYFDQCDVTEHLLKDIRAEVAVVSQAPYLFDDTIKNNILMGKLDATDEEVILAAQRANCMEFIEKLPQGINTKCGENATLLSGGQKQRLAIARAFLKDAPILILDEATSALDAESEQTVQAALADLVKGRTTLIIAHRFSSIQIATRILVFDDGKIVADGNHESLLQSSPLYKELYQKQNI